MSLPPSCFPPPSLHLTFAPPSVLGNCGNPALRLFGFGPVAPDGFGIGEQFLSLSQTSRRAADFPFLRFFYLKGYIIKDHGISVVAASKHLQTRRFLDTLAVVMLEFQKLIKKLWLEANRPLAGPFHAEALNDRDLLTEEDDELKAAEESLDGYGFYPIEDDGTTIKRGRKKRVGESPFTFHLLFVSRSVADRRLLFLLLRAQLGHARIRLCFSWNALSDMLPLPFP